MKKQEALKILEEYQEWRRGKDIPMLNHKNIGMAIDMAIETMKRIPCEECPAKMTKKQRLEYDLRKRFGSKN